MGILKQWSSEGVLDPVLFQKLTGFLDLLVEWNSGINLTGLRSREEMEEILVGESLLAIRAFPMSGKRVLDIGSGAGIPGLIWALYDPLIQLTSLEIREKKTAFQKEVLRALGVKAEVLKGRFPFAVANRSFDVITTRGVRSSPELWAQAMPILRPGGSLVRFANAGAVHAGWRSLSISDRSSLLIQPR